MEGATPPNYGQGAPPQNNDGPPPWLQHMFDAQAANITNMANAQAAAISQLREHVNAIESARSATSNTPDSQSEAPTMSGAIPATTTTTMIHRKARLPNPDKFDGTELSFFPQFEGLLQAKLDIDGSVIGDEKEKVWYAFGRLSGSAAARIFPWMKYAAENNTLSVEEFMAQLRTAFLDHRQQQKALGEINRTKQGSRPFREFLNDFDRLVMEAQGWGWDDAVKKGYLKAAINTKIMTAIVGAREEPTYHGYCQQLLTTDDQLKEIADLTAWRTKKKGSLPMVTTGASPFNPPGGGNRTSSADMMDWQPTVSTSAQRVKEGRWATPEVIAQRKEAGLCLRCGLGGHRVRECQAKLTFPKEKKVRVSETRREDERSLVRVNDDGGALVRVPDDDSDSDNSGKE